MLKTFYEYENKNIITNDIISEYCMAEHLNEEYFRFNMRKDKANNHSVVRNVMAALILITSNLFKH